MRLYEVEVLFLPEGRVTAAYIFSLEETQGNCGGKETQKLSEL